MFVYIGVTIGNILVREGNYVIVGRKKFAFILFDVCNLMQGKKRNARKKNDNCIL